MCHSINCYETAKFPGRLPLSPVDPANPDPPDKGGHPHKPGDPRAEKTRGKLMWGSQNRPRRSNSIAEAANLARIGPIDEWHLLFVKPFRHFALAHAQPMLMPGEDPGEREPVQLPSGGGSSP